MDICQHYWQPDPDNYQFQDCATCGASRRVRDYCPTCQGRGWYLADDINEDGYHHTIREPCGNCQGLRLIACEPKIL